MSKSHVVVVGGGGYGAKIARTLSTKLDPAKHTLTLISSREFYLHLPAVLRLIVSPLDDIENTALISYDFLFQGIGVFKRGTVTGVKKSADGKSGSVVLEGGEEVPWNVLLLAPGNEWEGGLDLPETRDDVSGFVNEWRKRFEKANKIVLVGGGSVGIELAGELRDIYPKKRITVVHANEYLTNGTYPVKFRKEIEKKLHARDIEVLLNTRVEDIPVNGVNRSVKSVDGKLIEADLVVPTRGGRPATSFLSTLSPNPLNTTGHIKVKQTLQLLFETNILAVGDVTDIKEQKMLGKAGAYVDIVAGNILALLQGSEGLKEYKGRFEGICITIGKYGGAGWIDFLWGLQFGDWTVANVKSKGLFIGMTRKSLGMTS